MKLKRILSIILLFVFLLPAFGCSECNESEAFVDDGQFMYGKITDVKSDEYGNYALFGQVNLDLSETIYVPPFYNGKEVSIFGFSYKESFFLQRVVVPVFKGVKKLYFSYNCDCLYLDFDHHIKYSHDLTNPYVTDCRVGATTVFIPFNSLKYIWSSVEQFVSVYNNTENIIITKQCFEKVKTSFQVVDNTVYYIDGEGYRIQIANTTYYFNYEGSPNDGIFFINDFERGGKIENTPYEPLREGYKFVGWYKETECINAWDFDNDTLPMPEYNDDGELKFAETKLYAKWGR